MALSRRVLLGRLATAGATGAAWAAGAGPAQAVRAPHGGGRRVHTGFDRLSADGYRLLDGHRAASSPTPPASPGICGTSWM